MSARWRWRPTSPTRTTRPFLRHACIAWRTTSSLSVAAVIEHRVGAEAVGQLVARAAAKSSPAPIPCAMPVRERLLDPRRVEVGADHPARRSRAAAGRRAARGCRGRSTATVSPSVGCTRRTPWSAIAPSVTVEAASVSSPSGIRTARLTGTSISSAWFAIPAPAQATRSPARKPLDLVADRDDDARGRIAGRQPGREHPADALVRAREALVLRDLEHALRMVRLLQRTPVERQPGHADARQLGPDRDARVLDADEERPRRRARRRHFLDRDAAAADQHLLHATYSFHQSAKLSRYQTSGPRCSSTSRITSSRSRKSVCAQNSSSSRARPCRRGGRRTTRRPARRSLASAGRSARPG